VQEHAKPQRGRKYFTLAEARRALPLVRRIAADARLTQLERLRLQGELSGPRLLPADQAAMARKELQHQTERLEELVAELAQVGAEMKDPLRGLLDFPALHEQRAVYLCWQHDEGTITHWHELDSGYAGRQPVALLHDHKQ
jgi:hypothetical protein